MTQTPSLFGVIDRPVRPSLAYRHTPGTGPSIVFLPGYASDMAGSKACAVYDWAVAKGQSCLLFDYSGCGQSAGDFANETLETWRDDAADVIRAIIADGPVVLIGSSMGGWLMLLVALAMPHRIAGLVGIAAAPDFTSWGYSEEQKAVLVRDGRLLEDNPYGTEPTLTTLALWQSGERNLLLDAPIALDCSVELLHGQADNDVPFALSLRLAAQLHSAKVRVQLIKDGDHRLSREEDIALLIATVTQLLARNKG